MIRRHVASRTARLFIALSIVLAGALPAIAQTLPAFPGAEGFGAIATGGRGGRVLHVITLDPDPAGINGGVAGAPNAGSLNWALRQPGPVQIVFDVSGVMDGVAYVRTNDVTVAGQTSPGGIIVRGIVCGVHYGGIPCDNLILRHLRSRPACQLTAAGADCPAGDDALRLDGMHRAMIDHVSLANANDETVQLSWASDVTIQESILGEVDGSHALYGGILMNYAADAYPLDRISVVRNLWYRIKGRLPEILCESSAQDDVPPRRIAACQDNALNLELANNLYFDPYYPMTYGRWVDGDPANGQFRLHMNLVGNRFVVRPDFPYGIADTALIANEPGDPPSANSLYVSDNRLSRHPALADYALFYCCNDFPPSPDGNQNPGTAERRATRHPFPAIAYLPGDELVTVLTPRVGALPHDPMDRRYAAAVLAGEFAGLPHEIPAANDALDLDFDPAQPPPAPPDSDADGMPDAFELRHGLDPGANDANGTTLSLPLLGIAGYTNIEVYFALLAAERLRGDDIFRNGFE